MDDSLTDSEDKQNYHSTTFFAVTPPSEHYVNEDNGTIDGCNMSISSYSEPNNRVTGYPLHNDTWANTVPVTKKDKSEKLHNWRAAGRAIRKMLTKGILPSRSSELFKDKNITRDSLRSCSDLNQTQLSVASDSQTTSDAMNEMYSEFENSHMNHKTESENQSLLGQSNDSIINGTDDTKTGLKHDGSKNMEINGTVSSVLKSLGMSSDAFMPQCQNATAQNFSAEPKQEVVRQKVTHSGTVKGITTRGCDNTHERNSLGTKKRSPSKDALNWHDLKQRITRLTQRSKKKENPESISTLNLSDTPQRDFNSDKWFSSPHRTSQTEKCKQQNSSSIVECDSLNMELNSGDMKVSKRHRNKAPKCKLQKDTEISSDEEVKSLTKSVRNKIKSKHKQSPVPSHTREPLINLNSRPEWHVEGMNPNVSASNAMILPAIPRAQTTCKSAFSPYALSPSHCSVGLEKYENNLGLPSALTLNDTQSCFADIPSQSAFSLKPEVSLSNPGHVIPVTSHASANETIDSNAIETTRYLWEDRPIFPTANILFDSRFQDEGFKDQDTILHPLSEEGADSGRDHKENRDTELLSKHWECIAKKKAHPKHKSATTFSKREKTKEPTNNHTNKQSLSTSGSSNSSDDNTMSKDGARRKTHQRKKMKRRRELVSIYSTGGGDMNMHGSQENLAELCPHQEKEICNCMLKFLNEEHSGSSVEGGESSLEERAFCSTDADSDSIPKLISSSSEEELAAQILMEKFRTGQTSHGRNDASSVPDLIDTDESDFCDDILPDVLLPGSDDEKDEPVELSPRELESLPELRSSSSSSAGSQADDEFECECEMCQQNQHLYAARNNSWITEEEEEYPGTGAEPAFSIHYHVDPFERERDALHDPFNLDLTELNPMDLLLMRQGRRDILEVMFQNVILQMLAVYPELLNDQAPPPLNAVDLDKIPVISIDSQHMAKDATCPICLCEFEKGEDGRQLGCQHIFHKLCIEAWVVKSGTCPVCRLVLSKKPAEQ